MRALNIIVLVILFVSEGLCLTCYRCSNSTDTTCAESEEYTCPITPPENATTVSLGSDYHGVLNTLLKSEAEEAADVHCFTAQFEDGNTNLTNTQRGCVWSSSDATEEQIQQTLEAKFNISLSVFKICSEDLCGGSNITDADNERRKGGGRPGGSGGRRGGSGGSTSRPPDVPLRCYRCNRPNSNCTDYSETTCTLGVQFRCIQTVNSVIVNGIAETYRGCIRVSDGQDACQTLELQHNVRFSHCSLCNRNLCNKAPSTLVTGLLLMVTPFFLRILT